MTTILTLTWLVVCFVLIIISSHQARLMVCGANVMAIIFTIIAITMILKNDKEKLLPTNLAIISIVTTIIIHIITKTDLFNKNQWQDTGFFLGFIIIMAIIGILLNPRKKQINRY